MKGSGEARLIIPGYSVGPLLAYRGKEGCEHPMCTRMVSRGEDGEFILGACMGWHCATCDAPCSSQGHKCPTSATDGLGPSPSTPGEGQEGLGGPQSGPCGGGTDAAD